MSAIYFYLPTLIQLIVMLGLITLFFVTFISYTRRQLVNAEVKKNQNDEIIKKLDRMLELLEKNRV